ncbi:electron transfer flavoprotein subunit alpha/FixB family protein [Brevibacillus brevis]|uniref:Electron transfer flavoprotein subunit alpha/FixB family protein n=1 Tax=Brevibacillus brevis TaxID=1393 RepID=A0ABY9T1J0_BREBE|nr:electron transfer flavoprotein subunit alpha/FixB family protein [Brevibacillus brevis]WNC12283.1 electron transfer flavoprotein subunit alpha/FixB family protein [Brevibacillus brevis]
MGRKVLILTEVKDGKLRQVSLEALSVAQQIADGEEIIAALFGDDSTEILSEISLYGAHKLYTSTEASLSVYTTDAYTQALVQLIQEVGAEVVLMGHTGVGKDLAPRASARLGAGLVTDCTGVESVDGNVIFTRPIYAGKAFQKKSFKKGILFATLRANNFAVKESPVRTEIVSFQPTIKDLRTIVKEVVRKAVGGVDLSEAKVVVSGGRGVKGAEGFQTLQALADVLGGAVGASRGACDAEYCDYSMQIGQTGKVVTPDLYIACGISGAIQHVAGMSNSKVIVAINKDPEAPIFQLADYGIVGDLFEVVPLLTEECKKVLSEAAVSS